jgi:formylglycine-generating enzyme required for sulfatase activity
MRYGMAAMVALVLAGCNQGVAPSEAPAEAPRLEVNLPGDGVSFRMVKVPAGVLRSAGSSDREVFLKGFWVAECEVSWNEFLRFYLEKRSVSTLKEFDEAVRTAYDYKKKRMRSTARDGVPRPSLEIDSLFTQNSKTFNFGVADYPVTNISWHAAVAYCDWLSHKTGQRFRLPTEAEWAYACLAGSDETQGANLSWEGQGWCESNSRGHSERVGTRKPNPWGICDMVGNVWEYCLEFETNPVFKPILRGGAWNSPKEEIGPNARTGIRSEWFDRDPHRPSTLWWLTGGFCQGFRVVRMEDGLDPEERSKYLRRIEVTVTSTEAGRTQDSGRLGRFVRLNGEIRNGGDRSLDEVEVMAYCTDASGAPCLSDNESENLPGRATFSKCFPVLVNSFGGPPHSIPIKPGERRAFSVEVPTCTDQETRFGARVSAIVVSSP